MSEDHASSTALRSAYRDADNFNETSDVERLVAGSPDGAHGAPDRPIEGNRDPFGGPFPGMERAAVVHLRERNAVLVPALHQRPAPKDIDAGSGGGPPDPKLDVVGKSHSGA